MKLRSSSAEKTDKDAPMKWVLGKSKGSNCLD